MRLLPMAIYIISGRIEEGQTACPESGERELTIETHRRGIDCSADCLHQRRALPYALRMKPTLIKLVGEGP
jgi:hypothetical protein